jgi:hypothetical protein
LSDYLSLARDRKYITVIIIILLSHGIYMNNNWRPGGTGLDGLGLFGQQSGALVAFVPPVSIKDRSLHWIP